MQRRFQSATTERIWQDDDLPDMTKVVGLATKTRKLFLKVRKRAT